MLGHFGVGAAALDGLDDVQQGAILKLQMTCVPQIAAKMQPDPQYSAQMVNGVTETEE